MSTLLEQIRESLHHESINLGFQMLWAISLPVCARFSFEKHNRLADERNITANRTLPHARCLLRELLPGPPSSSEWHLVSLPSHPEEHSGTNLDIWEQAGMGAGARTRLTVQRLLLDFLIICLLFICMEAKAPPETAQA